MSRLDDLMGAYNGSNDEPERLRIADEIIRQVAPRVKGYLRQQCSDPELAKEVAAATFHAASKAFGSFRGDGGASGESWFFGIAHHKLKDALRRKKREREEPTDLGRVHAAINSLVLGSMAPGELLDLEYALDLLRRVKPPCDKYLHLHYVLGWDYATMAAEFGKSIKAVTQATNRCLKFAVKLMKKKG